MWNHSYLVFSKKKIYIYINKLAISVYYSINWEFLQCPIKLKFHVLLRLTHSFQFFHYCLTKAQIGKPYLNYLRKNYIWNVLFQRIHCFCVCVIERQINTCLIAVSDNCKEVWRELVTSQPVAHYLWLLDTAGRFYCCIIRVGGISGQWRNFYRDTHGLLVL